MWKVVLFGIKLLGLVNDEEFIERLIEYGIYINVIMMIIVIMVILVLCML